MRSDSNPFYNENAPIRALLTVFFKRKREIAFVFAGFVLLSVFFTLYKKPVFEAKTQVLIKVARENAMDPYRGDRPPSVFIQQMEVVNSEREILKSRLLAEQVLKSLGPVAVYPFLQKTDLPLKDGVLLNPKEAENYRLEMAASIMERALIAENVKNSSLIDVRFRHEDPVVAAQVANKLVEKYIERHIDIHKANKSYLFFKQQSDELKAKLTDTEKKLKSLKEDHGITSFDEQQSLLLQQESKLRDDLSRTNSQYAETNYRIADLRRKLGVTQEKSPQGEQTNPNALLINTLEARIIELELREKELLHKYSEDSRLVRNVREELLLVREKLESREQKKYESSVMGINPNYQLLQREIIMDESQMMAIKTKIENLQRQLARVVQELEKLNMLKDQYVRLKKEFDIDHDNYKLYLGKLEESRISSAMDEEKMSNVRVTEIAHPPLRPMGPPRIVILVIGVVVGLFGSTMAAIVLEYLQQRVERPEEIESILGVPVLTSIPELTLRKIA